jgi:hypothetical protein
MGFLIVLAISIGMAVDASNIRYEGSDVQGFGPNPIGWFFFALFLPILAVPIYLLRRPELKAAAERRRLQAQTFAALPGAVYSAYAGYGQAGNPYAPRPPHPGAAPYPGAPYGAPPAQPPYGGPPPAQPPYGQAPPPQNPYGQPPQPEPPPAQPSPTQGQAPQAQAAQGQHHRSSSSSMTAGDLADGIRQLSDLRDRGLLNEAEFQARKAALLRKV